MRHNHLTELNIFKNIEMKKTKTRVLPRDRKVIGIDLGGTLSKIAVYVPRKKRLSISNEVNSCNSISSSSSIARSNSIQSQL